MVFDVVTGPVLTLYRDLTERRIELVITRTVEFADQSNMVVENLFDDDIVAVAAKQNPWTRRRQIDLAELVNELWTLPAHETGIGAFAIEAFRGHGLEPPRATVVTYSVHMRDKLLATGRFLTMLSSYTLVLTGQASHAQGIACRIRQCAWDDRHHHIEESYAQPARRAIHQSHPLCRDAIGEGKMMLSSD